MSWVLMHLGVSELYRRSFYVTVQRETELRVFSEECKRACCRFSQQAQHIQKQQTLQTAA